MSTMRNDIWRYDAAIGSRQLAGFKVEALDGSIGKIDEATDEAGSGSIIVDTGPWILGKKVMLPAGVISHVDAAGQKVFVHRTKDQIKAAPEYDDAMRGDASFRDRVGTYYGSGGAGWRDKSSI